MNSQHYYKVTVVTVDENRNTISRNSWTFPTYKKAVAKAEQYGKDTGDGEFFEGELEDSLPHVFDPSYPTRTKTMAMIDKIKFDR